MKTNAQLQKDVLEELKWNPSINEGDIGVSVRNGVVSLSGYVPNYAEKIAAESAAKRVAGVTGVVDDIKIKFAAGFGPKDDVDVAKAAMDAIKWHVWVPHEAIKLVVKDGWVNLSGSVEWEFQRKSTEKAIRYLAGVKGITNNITLKPKVKELDVKMEIEKALLRTANENVRSIGVSASNGEVRLSGKVHSWSEKMDAERAAWSATGVKSVENEIRVQ